MQLISKNTAVLSVLFTKNNIFCTISDLEGKTLSSVSTGSKKSKGLKKTTNLTIFSLIKDMNKSIKKLEISYLYLRLKGLSKNKNLFFKLFKNIKCSLLLIQSKNKTAYGGCKVSKIRKV